AAKSCSISPKNYSLRNNQEITGRVTKQFPAARAAGFPPEADNYMKNVRYNILATPHFLFFDPGEM
ncbi:MAG: hypothetical protein L0Y73_02270, partial [Candidatus Aminicenantes bacterium]|nr:hypothetical protein [Candidatus Aminicenantes bacterium]